MRYTVHTHRTFHHRITKYLGVLVGAALVATLGCRVPRRRRRQRRRWWTGTGDGTVGSTPPRRRGGHVDQSRAPNIQSLAPMGRRDLGCSHSGCWDDLMKTRSRRMTPGSIMVSATRVVLGDTHRDVHKADGTEEPDRIPGSGRPRAHLDPR